MTKPDDVPPAEPVEDVSAAEPVADAGDHDGGTAEPAPADQPEEPEEPDVVEGPRRRERRERAERREAQARATAIEQARREAKRAARGRAATPKPVARGSVRGLKLFLVTLLLFVVVTGSG